MNLYELNAEHCKAIKYKLAPLVTDSAEGRLWFGVLMQGLRDIGGPCYRDRIKAGDASGDVRREIIGAWRAGQGAKEDAIRWFGGKDYREVCGRAGLDDDYVTRILAVVLASKAVA